MRSASARIACDPADADLHLLQHPEELLGERALGVAGDLGERRRRTPDRTPRRSSAGRGRPAARGASAGSGRRRPGRATSWVPNQPRRRPEHDHAHRDRGAEADDRREDEAEAGSATSAASALNASTRSTSQPSGLPARSRRRRMRRTRSSGVETPADRGEPHGERVEDAVGERALELALAQVPPWALDGLDGGERAATPLRGVPAESTPVAAIARTIAANTRASPDDEQRAHSHLDPDHSRAARRSRPPNRTTADTIMRTPIDVVHSGRR